MILHILAMLPFIALIIIGAGQLEIVKPLVITIVFAALFFLFFWGVMGIVNL